MASSLSVHQTCGACGGRRCELQGHPQGLASAHLTLVLQDLCQPPCAPAGVVLDGYTVGNTVEGVTVGSTPCGRGGSLA